MRVLILGCNELTGSLVQELGRDDHEITVLSGDRHCLEQLFHQPNVEVIHTTEPLMQDYLRQGGIGRTDAFLALSGDDHQNILAAQIARHIFAVNHVGCHIVNPELQAFYADADPDLKVIGRSTGLLQDIRESIGT